MERLRLTVCSKEVRAGGGGADTPVHRERSNSARTNCAGATFRHANFKHARLDGTVLTGADLSGARNLAWDQLSLAVIDETTILPDYLVRKAAALRS